MVVSAISEANAEDFNVLAVRWRHSSKPLIIIDHINTPEGQAVAKAVGAYFGIDPKVVGMALMAAQMPS